MPEDPSLECRLLSISERQTFEIEAIKGSRFIAIVQPCRSIDLVQNLIDELWILHPKARHICWAFRGKGRDEFRWADDGEPTGTAGKPILNVIDGCQLSWVLVAVIRYFGGTKLGTGGLARAYSEATKAVIQQAHILSLTPKIDFKYTFDYHLERSIQHLLERCDARIKGAQYDTQVHLSCILSADRASEVESALIELSAGRIKIERSEVYLGA